MAVFRGWNATNPEGKSFWTCDFPPATQPGKSGNHAPNVPLGPRNSSTTVQAGAFLLVNGNYIVSLGSVCRWLARVCCASASDCWLAATVSQSVATSATRLMRVLRWVCAVAR